MVYASEMKLCGSDYIGFDEKSNTPDDMMKAASKFLANPNVEQIKTPQGIPAKPKLPVR